jgi:hypothetical protein
MMLGLCFTEFLLHERMRKCDGAGTVTVMVIIITIIIIIIIIVTITEIITIIINSCIEVLSDCDRAIRGKRYKIKNKKDNINEYY